MAKILIVDDDNQAVEQMTHLVAEAGHDADFLLEPDFLIEKLEADPQDLILLDFNMPGVDGLTLLERIKKHKVIRDIPVIMVTGDTEERLISLCFERGAVDFVKKPILPLELQSRIKIALTTREHIQAIQSQKEELEQSHLFTQTVLDNIRDALCVLDVATGTILEANRVFLHQIGCKREEIIGATMLPSLPDSRHEMLLQENRPKLLAQLSTIYEAGKAESRECQYSSHTGEERYTKRYLIPIRSVDKNAPSRAQMLIISRNTTERRLFEDRLKHLAFHDVLTGLPNRQLFNDRLEQALAQGRRHNQPVAVALFDLDRFKNINDTMGHDVGDMLLQEVSSRLLSCVRASDTVARLGGDEFTAVLTNIQSWDYAHHVAQKILLTLGERLTLGEHQLTITTSIGISIFPFDGQDIPTLLKK
ncbi:MAG: diguanylate cyclase, partial [Magnetococcales bacterium]|nr:diguanylate cyclase [Magnetococcales bacterium]